MIGSPPPLPSPFSGPPTPAHLEQIQAAKRMSVKIRRAVATAKVSGWTTAIFAAGTIALSLTSFWGIVLGAGMAVISIIEFRGVTELQRLDPTAPKRLALNQLAFGLLLFGYGAFMLWDSFYGGGGKQQIQEMVGDMSMVGDPQMQRTMESLASTVAIALYGSVMLAAILGPGLTAVYYYTRKKYIERYLRETPQWIIDLQRAGMNL
jgi:hypothetical protein